MVIEKLLGTLEFLLKRGDIAYKSYMSNGKIFLYAKIIKENNRSIKELLLENAYLLPPSQQLNAIDLVIHIDVWSIIWEDLDKKKSHSLNDEFCFKNNVNFPQKSIDSLLQYFATLNQNKVKK